MRAPLVLISVRVKLSNMMCGLPEGRGRGTATDGPKKEHRHARRNSETCSLPACGERVGVRGPFHDSERKYLPLRLAESEYSLKSCAYQAWELPPPFLHA